MFRLGIHFHHITGTEIQQAPSLIPTTRPEHNKIINQRCNPAVAVTCILSCWGWWSAACRPCCMWPARRYRWPPSCSPGWCGPSLWSNHCPQFLHPRNVKKLLRRTINLNTSIFIGVIRSKGVGTGTWFQTDEPRRAILRPGGQRPIQRRCDVYWPRVVCLWRHLASTVTTR